MTGQPIAKAVAAFTEKRDRKETAELLERIYQRLLRERENIAIQDIREGYLQGNEEAKESEARDK